MDGGHAVIVGGGIGGLAAAVGLRHAGWRATVLERGQQRPEIGAGISLTTNAQQALAALGFGAELDAMSRTPARGELRTSTGRTLNTFDANATLTDSLLVLHRADLHGMLRSALPADWVRHSAAVTDVRTGHGSAGVFADDTWLEADLVIGADGVRSLVRRTLWPGHPGPVYSGSTAWRSIIRPRGAPTNSMTIGDGGEFGVVPLADGRVYWFGAAAAPAHGHVADERAAALRRFGHWPAPIPELIEQTPAEAVLRHDLDHLATPLPSFVTGRVALLGDAAHAMTPNLGQGGGQTLEDAVELAAALAELPVPQALRRYDARRRPRSQRIAALSARAGRIIRLRNPALSAARNLVIRLLPAEASAKRAERALEWTVPVINGSNSTSG